MIVEFRNSKKGIVNGATLLVDLIIQQVKIILNSSVSYLGFSPLFNYNTVESSPFFSLKKKIIKWTKRVLSGL